jgi:hypothetical protein
VDLSIRNEVDVLLNDNLRNLELRDVAGGYIRRKYGVQVSPLDEVVTGGDCLARYRDVPSDSLRPEAIEYVSPTTVKYHLGIPSGVIPHRAERRNGRWYLVPAECGDYRKFLKIVRGMMLQQRDYLTHLIVLMRAGEAAPETVQSYLAQRQWP